MEILSPAGSYEAAVAAVQSGADAIYLGSGKFNARRGAANFDDASLKTTVEYCHQRGVRVHLTLNILLSDKELEQARKLVELANRIGVDALIVQDLGVVDMVRQVAPQLPIHASTQMTVHNLDGVLACAALGIERVVLSRELSKSQISYICRRSPIEIEVFGHGALCMCYSGQCFLSSAIGGRSGNRGMCAQPCRMQYGWEGSADGYPLSLKDMSLVEHLTELERMGVASLKIEGRMKRPEYVGIVTRIYSDVLHQHRQPTAEELARLETAFSRQGFTDGYWQGHTGAQMFGIHEKTPLPEKLFAQTRMEYNREHPRVPVAVEVNLQALEPVRATVTDPEGRSVTVYGPVPEGARSRSVTEEDLRRQLGKTGGTCYTVSEWDTQVEPGLSVPLSGLNEMRRRMLDQLSVLRIQPPKRSTGTLSPIDPVPGHQEAPVCNVALRQAYQLSEGLIRCKPGVIYLPAELIVERKALVEKAIAQGIEVCAMLPRILSDRERGEMITLLEQAKELGVHSALAGELGGVTLAAGLDLSVRGDFGIGTYNSRTLHQLAEMGLVSATLSFEQRLAAVRDLSKPIDTELIVYGRLPLMITENCIIKNRSGRCNCTNTNQLTDRTGAAFPVLRAYGCRNEIFNSKKLYLADKRESWSRLGLWAVRLNFTTENARECSEMLEQYQNGASFAPVDFTRGLYFRGVD